jgi:hypothetical protein
VHLGGRPIHRRIIEALPGKRWSVRDLIEGRGSHLVESFIHIHPELRLVANSHGWLVHDAQGAIARISITGATAEQQSAIYCPQFGIRQTSQSLVLRVSADLPIELGFVIERV